MNYKHLLVQKNKTWVWTAVDHFKPGILGLVLGDHSPKSFQPLCSRLLVNRNAIFI
jgi:IS1 family transposase